MLPFLINRLVISSPQSGKAKIVNFSPTVTVITGENGTGKSSIIKSLYYAFGAQPRMKSEWQNVASQILVKFSVGNRRFSILRTQDRFTVFDSDDKPIFTGVSVSKDIGPFLAQLFRFGLKLTPKDGNVSTPTPAFLFLPFYFDQDTSWINAWAGFERLQQFRDWRKDLIEYHVGLKPNEYYDVKGKHLQTKTELDVVQAQHRVLKSVREQINEKYQDIAFEIDLDQFQEEIKELLVHCGTLQRTADRIKEKLVGLYNSKIQIESQLEIVKKALGEINADLSFLTTIDEHIDCPTCGADYNASFAEIFGIAQDEGKCQVLMDELHANLTNVTDEIAKVNADHQQNDFETARVRSILEKKREQVQLKDLIDSESKKKLKSVLQANLDDANQKTITVSQRIEELKKQLDSFTSKDKKAAIGEEFLGFMRDHLLELAVHGLPEKSKKDFTASIREQGSDQPRALLAYAFSILKIMRHRSSSAFCPIIIDSPIQQEQDEKNHLKILDFIKRNRPEGGQIVLGVFDTKGIDFGGAVIELKEKWQVLQKAEYELASGEVEPFVRKAIAFRHGEDVLL